MDLLRWPVVGALARRRHARLALQLPLLVLAGALVAHGMLGPQLAPRNLSTVLTWVHYRGLLVVAVLAIGNLFCTGCPMILARDAGRRLFHPGWRWPRHLRNKWPAIVLFVAVLFAYEQFDLWSLPRATAWLIVAYFAAAVAVDTLFAGATFCKYVCPIGQFNFIASTMSPAELRVRDIGTCQSCRTADCIKGRRAARPMVSPLVVVRTPAEGTKSVATMEVPRARDVVLRRGCELGLFLPAKVGNLDCTLCLDCVHACPHDNIALASRLPGAELSIPERRSGIGRLARRGDFAALAVVFTFGALLNAFAMTGAGTRQPVALLVLAVLGVLPAAMLGGAAYTSRLLTGVREPLRELAARFAWGLVPLGLGIWVAHYGFHFLTGVLTFVPVVQSAAIDLTGRAVAGEPLWTWVGMPPGAVLPLQAGSILLGALGSLGTTQRIATEGRVSGWRAMLPWSVVIIVLAVASLWVMMQPMDMRGVEMPG